ncbi:DUF4376 domain-containing protein [Salmonella enterica subsp. enterica serovar Kentucky]|uniref:DUF4376 domain-containing protein n=6 Tax=Salmonella enterica TaxID=28901 RepID=A0A5U3HRL5_SALER|nr:DUF4376 domain-containing protein [Salmonella enterica]EAA4898376.1 DUF4376 domain-containing protein [Salmonella enterica subsp. enterica serovar Oranienburg]EAB6473599.1 DUF4376 domain-containing protein [Salmonella enterica subsp. enterica]EBF9679555.1 DUF4376 domain-containing protein [Salmonella enterica subsp. enterica serovar Glostrup]EBG8085414.1 DUF4376 domain-containing protein [Salmonella enterica subsp. enterica serovar Montevideo]EBK1668988.1 DUF4376 domain-containing protein [
MTTTVITDAKNGRYCENGTIMVDVRFDDLTAADGTPLYLPYIATKNDPEPYGVLLYNDLVSGKYGQIVPFTATPEMLQAAKDTRRAEVCAWRDAQENGNYLFDYNGHRWDYGKSTQDRMSISLVMAKRNALPADFAWTDGDNNIVPMDNAGLIALSAAIEQAMFEKGMQINQRQLQMKAEVEALTTLEAVKAYVVGWAEGI